MLEVLAPGLLIIPIFVKNTFWKVFIFTLYILVNTLLYLYQRSFARDETLTWMLLSIAALLAITLSPLQRLFNPSEKRAPIKPITIFHDPEWARNQEAQLE